MTEKYSTKNYKSGYSPSRLQHNYKMTYGDAYNLAQDLNKVFNRLYTVEQEKKRLRKALLAIEYETPALGGRKKDMRTALLQIDCICRSVFEREE